MYPDLYKLRIESSNPNFWDDSIHASNVLKKISIIEKEIEQWNNLSRRHDDMEILFEFAEAGEADLSEIHSELENYKSIIDEIEI